jgi:transcriptional regulator with XRE-family HTH domain
MLSDMKTLERKAARWLRHEEGMSVKEIERILDVSRSSVSLWVRDIQLTPEQHAALLARNPCFNGQLKGSNVNRERSRLRRRGYQLEGRRRMRELDSVFVAGCMLYWAEGAKKRTAVDFSNSDPEVIRFFARFLRRCFAVTPEQTRICCHLFADHIARQREIEQFWLDVAGLPHSSLRKSMVNHYSRSSQRKRTNRLPYGTCKLVVHSTEVVQQIFGGIQELGGFNRPAWLD